MTNIEMQACNAIIEIAHNTRNSKEIDWEQRRYEIAKDMFTATYFGGNNGSPLYWEEKNASKPVEMAKSAVIFADALINELKTNPINY